MVETMKASRLENRRLRRHPDLAGSTEKEIAAGAASLPYLALVSVLGRDDAFMAAVDTVRRDPLALDSLAKKYAPKPGAGRRLIAHMLSTAAAEPDRLYAQFRLDNLASSTLWADAELDEGERVRWGRTNAGYKQGARLVARRGADVCLAEECGETVPGRRLWCRLHEQRLASQRESDERSMRTVLAAAARALDV